jgi:Lon protease-like protein
MSRSPFDPIFEDLPETIPIFPLSGALLLPGSKLPLNIFEPRYLAMIRDTLAGPRVIGMVQPRDPEEESGTGAVYEIGCAGRIIEFSESDDGRYLITLSGLLRFTIAEELAPRHGYRQVRPDWQPFAADFGGDEPKDAIERGRLLATVRRYFAALELSADWEAIDGADSVDLVTTLAIVCPFEPREKQALLEAVSLADRGETLMAIMDMASLACESARPQH